MKFLNMCQTFFVLPDDFEGTPSDALRLLADHAETYPPETRSDVEGVDYNTQTYMEAYNVGLDAFVEMHKVNPLTACISGMDISEWTPPEVTDEQD